MSPAPLLLRDYLSILWSRRKILLAVLITTVTVALVYSVRQTPAYLSSSQVIVFAARLDPNQPAAATGYVNMDTEEQVANSTPVAELAAKRLMRKGLAPAATSATRTEGAETITFTSEGSDPTSTQASADAYAEAYLQLRQEGLLRDLELAREPYETSLEGIKRSMEKIYRDLSMTNDEPRRSVLTSRLQGLWLERTNLIEELNGLPSPENVHAGEVIQTAAYPESPASPRHLRNGALALMVGLALGIAAAFLRDRLDERVRGRAELELHSRAPVLAFIPRISSERANSKPIALSEPTSEGSEAYNALRVRLVHIAEQRSLKTIIVTSSIPGEGKTSTVANLAVSLARTGKNVVMVSADLRRPRLHQYFDGEGNQYLHGQGQWGLTDVLHGYQTSAEAVFPTNTSNVWLVDTGPRTESDGASALLGSDRMRDLLSDLRDFADFVLVDTPPLLTSSDAVAIAPLTDGALFVVDPRLVERSVVEQARQELQLSGGPVIGVVVNRYDRRWFRAYGSGYDYIQNDRGDAHDRPSHGALQPVADEIER